MRQIATFLFSTALASPGLAASPAEIVENYANLGQAGYGDSLTTALALQKAVDAFLAAPSAEGLEAARTAWKAARVPYQQTEVFRFANPVVDDWEGKVNAWPLDEGLIDYVSGDYVQNEDNALSTLNVVATEKFMVSGAEVDASKITPELISGTLHEAEGIEANVASGYHAVEFMLWGQDLNGTGPGAGARPYTDYVQGDGCTNGHCDRRAAYLKAVTDLLVSDLTYQAAQWQPGGAARNWVTKDPTQGLMIMLTGMGSLSYGELAGERMKLGLMLNDPEEEEDCFSDNTYNSHFYDGVGIQNVLLGRYVRVDGTEVSGPALADLVAEKDKAVAAELTGNVAASVTALQSIKTAAEGGLSYDMMLAAGNAQGDQLIMGAVDALVTQTASIQRAVSALGLNRVDFEGSDSLNTPEAVFK
jgi:putative iron-regulated protein